MDLVVMERAAHDILSGMTSRVGSVAEFDFRVVSAPRPASELPQTSTGQHTDVVVQSDRDNTRRPQHQSRFLRSSTATRSESRPPHFARCLRLGEHSLSGAL